MDQQPKPQKYKKTRLAFPIQKNNEYSSLNNELYIQQKEAPTESSTGEYSLNINEQEILTELSPRLEGTVIEGPQSFQRVSNTNQVIQGNNAVYKEDKIHIIGYNNKNFYELDDAGNAYYSNALYSGNEISQNTKVLTQEDLKNRFVYILNYQNSHSIGDLEIGNVVKNKSLLISGKDFTSWTPWVSYGGESGKVFHGDLTEEGINCLRQIFCNDGDNTLSAEEKNELASAMVFANVYGVIGGAEPYISYTEKKEINKNKYVINEKLYKPSYQFDTGPYPFGYIFQFEKSDEIPEVYQINTKLIKNPQTKESNYMLCIDLQDKNWNKKEISIEINTAEKTLKYGDSYITKLYFDKIIQGESIKFYPPYAKESEFSSSKISCEQVIEITKQEREEIKLTFGIDQLIFFEDNFQTIKQEFYDKKYELYLDPRNDKALPEIFQLPLSKTEIELILKILTTDEKFFYEPRLVGETGDWYEDSIPWSPPDVSAQIVDKITQAFKDNIEKYKAQVNNYLKSISKTTNLIFYYVPVEEVQNSGISENNVKPIYAYPTGGGNLFQIFNTVPKSQIFVGAKEDFLPVPNFKNLQLCQFDAYFVTTTNLEKNLKETEFEPINYLDCITAETYENYTLDDREKLNFEIKKATTPTGGTDVKGNYHKYTLKFTCVSYNTYFSSPYEPQLAITLDKNNNIVCVNSRWENIETRYESKIEGLTLGEEYTVILFYEEYDEPVESTPNTGSDTQA